MPYKEMLTLGALREPAVNINFSVGVRGDNGQADVMLIQTIFHYISNLKGKPMKNAGFSLSELPSITGRCCEKTINVIRKFQRHNANRLLRVDGLIEPAKYSGRNIQPGQRYMTMTYLHFLCTEMALHSSEPNYIEALGSMVPQLRSWLA